jgi:hypothetical protein
MILDNRIFSANWKRKYWFRSLLQIKIKIIFFAKNFPQNSLTFWKKYLIFTLLWESTQIGRLYVQCIISGCSLQIEVENIHRGKPLFEKILEILFRSSLFCNPRKTQNKFYSMSGYNKDKRLMKQDNETLHNIWLMHNKFWIHFNNFSRIILFL